MELNSSVSCPYSKAVLSSFLPPFLTVELLLGLPGVMVALWIFGCRIPVSRPCTTYLLNLVMADFLLLVGLPFQIDYFMRCDDWVFGEPMCRINLYMLTVNRSASIAFMSIVTVDRYFKVVHPVHRVNQVTVGQARLIALAAWGAVVSLRLPLFTNEVMWTENNKTLCQSFGKPEPLSVGIKMHYVLYMGEFFLPFIMLLFCTLRITCVLHQRQMDRKKKMRRAMHVVLAVMFIFICCFLPTFLTSLCALFLNKAKNETAYETIVILFRISVTFTYMNSVLDPIIYCFCSSFFHNYIKGSLVALGLNQMRLSRRASTSSDG